MTSRDFCFWLQGFFDISNTEHLTPAQIEMVKRHLSLVFKHEIDPQMGPPAYQAKLNHIHQNGPVDPTALIARC